MQQTFLPQAWIAHDKHVKPYIWSHRFLALTESIVGLVFLGWLLVTEGLLTIEQWIGLGHFNPWLSWMLYFGFFAFLWKLITFPLDVGGYLIEKRFELSKQTFGGWFKDQVKGWILGALLGIFVLSAIYLFVELSPSLWWLYTSIFLFCFSVLLAQLAPILLIPLFYKLKPMQEGPLKERLLKMCKKFSVEVKDVYHLGLGEKTEKGNAAFVGLGKTKRIIIGDTFYEKYGAEEVEAVFAHELGHQVHNDIWRSILLGAVILFLTFGITHTLCERWFYPLFGTETSFASGIFLYFVVLSFIQKPFGVLQAMHSRSREWAADKFASEKVGMGEDLGNALEKLTYQNRGQFKPNGLWEFLTYSHPAPWRRILRVRPSI